MFVASYKFHKITFKSEHFEHKWVLSFGSCFFWKTAWHQWAIVAFIILVKNKNDNLIRNVSNLLGKWPHFCQGIYLTLTLP